MAIDTTIIDEIIHGKIEPKIYAFHTGTIPDYLKVGDTYRPVSVRLDEWRRSDRFPDLVPIDKTWDARLDENTYFRDLEVHSFLEGVKHFARLQPGQFPSAYYSREFFKDAKEGDIDEAVEDIKKAHDENSPRYQFYSLEEKHSQEYHYTRSDTYPMRPNQKKTVRKFLAAKEKGITKMLMFAVMRFGKSFTSMQCALAMNAKFVLVVSGKADVKEEWKKTVESHVDFRDYIFLTREDLEKNYKVVSERLAGVTSNKIVVFLTLQDLNGSAIKKRHSQIFKNDVDLLIVDETHFAARAEKLGKVLKEEASQDDRLSDEEKKTVEDAEKYLEKKKIRANITLHLSGTPYEILAEREFKEDAIIAQYQFSDIISDRQKWDADNADAILKGDSDVADGGKPVYEWDNPYFGFPEMIRFAFHLNKSAKEKLIQLEKEGKTTAFSELFATYSNDAQGTGYDKFRNEHEVLDLLKVIDGTEQDENIFAFLNYDKIKDGRMCRHMVMVLPYCASCDAMAKLLEAHKDEFNNLSDYNILNISGFDCRSEFNDIPSIKGKISDYEGKGEKTLTLTVNRMLTGCTVPEWDTMIYLKGTASPQEYDQAIFRLQSQFIKTYADGNKRIKIDMKPQTLLVDFMPNRVFYLQGKKSGIHNANTEKFGGDELSRRIDRDLQISPIITVNANKLERVEPAQIMEAISRYSVTHGVFEEADNIPIDYQLQRDAELSKFISSLPEYKSKGGIQIPAVPDDDNGTDMDEPEDDDTSTDTDTDSSGNTDGASPSGQNINKSSTATDTVLDGKTFAAKLKTLFSNILYYSFLTADAVNSLDQILQTIDKEENRRIAGNLGLKADVLWAIRNKIDPFILGEWDFHIFNINKLSNDKEVEPLQRALTVIGQLSKISASEVKTPEKICDEMIALFPDEFLLSVAENCGRLLDIASKTAEYPLALYKRMRNLDIDEDKIKQCIYAIPTSKMTYEFTLKFYRILGLEEDHIASFTSYDLLEVRDKKDEIDYERITKILTQNKPFNQIKLTDEPQEGEETVKFEAVVGNPPYQEPDGGAQKSARPIYQEYVYIGENLSRKFLSLVTPTRWFSGGKGLDEFRQHMLNDIHIKVLHDYTHPEDVFPDTNNRGGVCYFFRDMEYDNTSNLVNVVTHGSDQAIDSTWRSLKTQDLDIFVRDSNAIRILQKISHFSAINLDNYVSAAKAFGFRTFFIKDCRFRSSAVNLNKPIKCFGRAGKIGYVDESEIPSHREWVNKWKVYVPESNNIGTELNDDNQNVIVGEPLTICTETYLVVGADLNLNEESANNLANYLKTRFARYLHSVAKVSQHGTAKTYRFVPVQDFTERSDIDWSKPIAKIDEQLFDKYNLSKEERDFINSKIKDMG